MAHTTSLLELKMSDQENIQQVTKKLPKYNFVTRPEVESFFEESRKSRQEMLATVHDLTESVREVRSEMKEFKEATKDMVEVFRNLQGLSNILIWIGKIMKPLAWLAAVLAAVTAYFQGYRIPKLME